MIKSIFTRPAANVGRVHFFDGKGDSMISSLLADETATWYLFPFEDALTGCGTLAIFLTIGMFILFVIGLVVSKANRQFLKTSGLIAAIYAIIIALLLSVVACISNGIFADAMTGCRTIAIWLTIGMLIVFVAGLIASKANRLFLKTSGIIAIVYAMIFAIAFSVIGFIDGGIKTGVFVPIVTAGAVVIICAVISAVTANKALKKALLAVGVIAFAGALVAIGIYYSTGKSLEDNWLTAEQVNQVGLYVSAALLTAVIIALAFIFDTGKKGFDTKSIAFAAICIAMSFALSYIRIVKMPQGGSVTIAAFLPLMLYSYMFGTKKGIFAGAIYGLLQALQDPYILHPAQFMLDYIIAFAGIGLSGMFAGFTKLHPSVRFVLGGLVGGIFRFTAAFLSGMFAFGAFAPEGTPAAIYSLTYQATYVPLDIAIVLAVGALVLLSKSLVREIDKVRLFECDNIGGKAAAATESAEATVESAEAEEEVAPSPAAENSASDEQTK